MTRRLLCSLLLIVTAASLSSGAMWQPVAVDDDPDPCPDLTNPNAPPNRLFCELLARIDYLLGITTCDEYKDEWTDCQGIPNLFSDLTESEVEQIIDSFGEDVEASVDLPEFQFRIVQVVVE